MPVEYAFCVDCGCVVYAIIDDDGNVEENKDGPIWHIAGTIEEMEKEGMDISKLPAICCGCCNK